MNSKLVIDGGSAVRDTEFKSKPYITEKMKSKVLELMEEKQFSKFIGSVFTKVKLNALGIQTLTKTRNTLLPKLMSGQIRVKNL